MDYSLIVVGCGATGSNLTALLSQYAVSQPQIKEIYLIDGDQVEAKNFRNQKFTEKDINKNKAKVLATRYSKLGITVNYIDNYIENEHQLITIINNCIGKAILIGCVDNNKARKYMHYAFINCNKNYIYYIDTGNGDILREGQTVMGIKENKKVIQPSVAEMFPEILEEAEEPVEDFKCSQIEEHPQNFATNVMSASVVFTMVSNLISLNLKNKTFVRFNTDKLFIK